MFGQGQWIQVGVDLEFVHLVDEGDERMSEGFEIVVRVVEEMGEGNILVEALIFQ